MTAAPHLAIENVRKLYQAVAALDDVSLSVQAHDYVVLLGPSGSGKTTLLSVIGGFAVPTSGRVRIAGRDVTDLGPAVRPTTTVFQDYALFPHMSVAANIGFGLKLRHVPAAERQRRVEQALDMVGLAGFGAAACMNSPAASASAWRWRARSSSSRRSCCWMSLWVLLTSICAGRCRMNCWPCSGARDAVSST